MSRTLSMNSASVDSLKLSSAMWLKTERPPDQADRGLGHACGLGHGTSRPMRGAIGRPVLQGLYDHRLHLVIGDGPLGSRPRLVEQPFQAVRHEPGPPLAHRHRMHLQLGCHRLVGRTISRTGQDDPSPQGQRLCRLSPIGQPLQGQPLLLGEHQRLLRSSTFCHAHLHARTAPTRSADRKFPKTQIL